MPPDMHVLPTSQACPWGQSRRSYETVLSKYKPREPAGWGGGDCLRSLVSPPCHKAMSTRLQLLPLGWEQGSSYCPRWKLGPVLYCSGILLNFSDYFWLWPFWGFELVTQDRIPAPPLWAIWDRNRNPCTKTQIHQQSNSKEIENYVIKEMIVFKHITFLAQMLVLIFFFFWEGHNLKSLEAREQRSGNWFRKAEKVKIQSSNGENWRLNPESWKGEGTDNIGISRLGDKGGVNDNEGHGQAVWEALNPHCIPSLPLSHTPIAFPSGSLPGIIWRK